jgi:2,3-bisphosphoglycerate-independent phosphoglycerate mutase
MEKTSTCQVCGGELAPAFSFCPSCGAPRTPSRPASTFDHEYDFIVVNFANGDMVGHTGVYGAIEKAVVAVDKCVGEVIDAVRETSYEAIIIADHGNADYAVNADGTPNTAHSLNPVPFIYITENKNAKVKNGILADVAPSILHLMGLQQPEDMTGEILIED